MPTLAENDAILRDANEACKGGHHWRTRLILFKWRPEPRPSYIKTPRPELLLRRAVENGCADLVQNILPKKPRISSNLVGTAIRGEAPIPVLKAFLACGWEVNSNPESTALNQAISKHNETLVDWLLACGANPNLQKTPTHAPLVKAACYGNLHIVKALIKHGANLKDTEALAWVTSMEDTTAKPLEMMEYLLDMGVDVNHVQKAHTPPNAYINVFMGTALHHAVKTRDVRRLELLLARGADWSLKNVRGFTPLETAKKFRYTESIRILAPLENPALQDESEMEQELKHIAEEWLRKDREWEKERVFRDMQQDRKRVLTLLRERMHQQDEVVEKLLIY